MNYYSIWFRSHSKCDWAHQLTLLMNCWLIRAINSDWYDFDWWRNLIMSPKFQCTVRVELFDRQLIGSWHFTDNPQHWVLRQSVTWAIKDRVYRRLSKNRTVTDTWKYQLTIWVSHRLWKVINFHLKSYETQTINKCLTTLPVCIVIHLIVKFRCHEDPNERESEFVYLQEDNDFILRKVRQP